MNVVLYTRDFEPITIIDLPMWALEHGERLRFVRVATMEPPSFSSKSSLEPIPLAKEVIVTLEFHPILRPPHKRSWLITVDDDVLALKLKPSWLPGQRGAINQYERATRELSLALLNVLARGVGGH